MPDPLNELEEFIIRCYDLAEIKDLCFALVINYEQLRGEILSEKVHDLLIYCGNEQKFKQLIDQVAQERPHLAIPSHSIQEYYNAFPVFSLTVQMPRPPEPLNHFINRDDLRQTLAQGLKTIRGRIHKIDGLGGVGKTSLALQVANDVLGHFRGGVIWLSFTTSPSLGDLSRPIIEAYEATPGEDLLHTALLLLKRHQPLLVLDNVDSSNPAVQQFIAKAQGTVTMLLTTTDRLLAGTHSERLTLKPLARQHAMALCLQHLERDVSETEIWLINDLCELVGDLPLAVIVAAGYINNLLTPLEEYLDRLRDSPLGEALELSERREESVRVTLEQTYQRFSTDARLALTVLALDEGESVKLATLAAGMRKELSVARSAGDELVRYSLVSRLKNGRFQLHSLVRRYAQEKAEWPQKQIIQSRLVEYYLSYVKTHNQPIRKDYTALDTERSSIWAILNLIEEMNDWARLAEFTLGLKHFMDVRGYWHEERERLEQCLKAMADTHQGENLDHTKAKLQLVLGFMLYRLAEFQKAEQQLLASLALSRQLGDKETEQKNIYNLGFVYLEDKANTEEAYIAKHEKALEQFRTSLLLAEQLNDLRATIMSKQQMGKCLAHLGRHAQAGDVLQECLTIYRNSDLDDERLPAFTYFYLGLNAHLQPRNEQAALDEYHLSLTLSRFVGDQLLMAETLTNIAEAKYTSGDIPGAQEAFLEARALTEKLQDSLLSAYQIDLIQQYPKILRANVM